MAVTYSSGAVSTGINIGTQAYSAYQQIPNKEDPRRFQEAATWYTAAINGDSDALCTLEHMTGNAGCTTCGKYGYRCGFATDIAKAYCATVYNQAVNVINGRLPRTTPIPPPPGAGMANTGSIQTIGQTAGTIADIAGGVATASGYPTTQLGSPTQTRERLEAAGWIALALIGGVVLYFVVIKRR